MRLRAFLITAITLATCLTARGADGLIELTTAGKAIQGRKIAHDSSRCWLVDREGRLSEIDLSSVTAFRQVAPEYSSTPILEVRNRLRKELGREYEVVTRGDYVVCAPPGRANAYAELLDRVSRQFMAYFQVRKFELLTIQYPLVAFVYPTQQQFFERCRADGIAVSETLRGYYHPQSNWIIFYDESGAAAEPQVVATTAKARPKRESAAPRESKPKAQPSKKDPVMEAHSTSSGATIEGLTRETTVHEAVHQLAFNCGLHERTGEQPLWIIEGLAMQFESSMGQDSSGRAAQADVNPSRLRSFADYRVTRRQPGALVQIISDDQAFRTSPIDSYGEAWMLSHYLLQTRPAKYAEYLKMISGRPIGTTYSPEERLTDFKSAFGDDLAWFEVEYVRFADNVMARELKSGSAAKSSRK